MVRITDNHHQTNYTQGCGIGRLVFDLCRVVQESKFLLSPYLHGGQTSGFKAESWKVNVTVRSNLQGTQGVVLE
jgi:hypothetical protein